MQVGNFSSLARWNQLTLLASGIGKECALAFAAHGAAGVVLADRDLTKVRETARRSTQIATNSSYQTIATSVDVSDPAQVRDMVCQALSTFGKIDYNVNCAGVSH